MKHMNPQQLSKLLLKNRSALRTWLIVYIVFPGAIIGDRDRKCAPFLVLGLAPWYGTSFLFLEQIAPSRAAHTRTCCEDFCGRVAQGKWRPKFPKSYILLAHYSTRLCLLKFCLRICVVSCSSLSEVKWSEDSVEFRYVPLYVTDQVVFRCFFYENFTLFHSKFHICIRLTSFP